MTPEELARKINAPGSPVAVAYVAGGGTEVSIAQAQKLRGYSRTGGFLMGSATKKKLDEALEGLERVTGTSEP